jgi:hypothetical protein
VQLAEVFLQSLGRFGIYLIIVIYWVLLDRPPLSVATPPIFTATPLI